MINVILQFLGLDLFNVNVSAKFYQNIPNGLRVNLHFFQNLNLGKTSTNPKCLLTISWATSCPYTNMYAKFHHNIPLSLRDRASFTFFRIWSSAKPQPMKNDISQSLGLDLDNINVYAEVYRNIPLSSRDKAIFTFFHNLALGKASTDIKCHFAIVSLLQNLNLGKNSTNLKCQLTISWTTPCQYQCVCKISSQYSTQFKS